jgi:hypothetical protein
MIGLLFGLKSRSQVKLYISIALSRTPGHLFTTTAMATAADAAFLAV